MQVRAFETYVFLINHLEIFCATFTCKLMFWTLQMFYVSDKIHYMSVNPEFLDKSDF